MAVSGERDGHLSSDVGREHPPNRAALAERMRDYALATLICVSSSHFRAQLPPSVSIFCTPSDCFVLYFPMSFVLPFWFGR